MTEGLIWTRPIRSCRDYRLAMTMVSKKLNIVFFTGQSSYPEGMAGTKRIQHAIDVLKNCENVAVRVVVPRQSVKENPPRGNHKGVPYETVMPDLIGPKMALMAPLLWLKTIATLMRAWRPGWKNIIYKYGPPSIDDTLPMWYARRKGYLVTYDIVEDDDVGADISPSLRHWIHTRFYRAATDRITRLADAVIIISSHLESKFNELVREQIPVHFRPISVDFGKLSHIVKKTHRPTTLFYAGSFGVKDGVEILIDAFNILSSSSVDFRLVLTGKGSPERMRVILDKVDKSPSRDRIDYKGYLNEQEYYETLNAIDVPCMTRIDLPWAHAGFPFKLGEFLASGKPVISSAVGDVSKLLSDRIDVLLVKPGSADAVVSAIRYLHDHPERAEQIGKAGRERAKQLFDNRIQGEKLYEFMQSLKSDAV